MFVLHRDERCWIGQFTNSKGVLSHLLWATGIGRSNSDYCILSNLRRFGDIFAWTNRLKCAISHRCLDLVKWNSWYTDADRVSIACIKHVHQVGRYCGTWLNNGIILRELSADSFAITIHHLHISLQSEITSLTTNGFV